MNAKPKLVAINTAVIVAVLLGFVFMFLIRNVLFLVFISILLSTAIEPIVNLLRRGPFNRGMGILVVYTVIVGLLALIIIATVPPLLEEGSRAVAGLSDQAKTDEAIRQGLGQGFLANTALSAYHGLRDVLNNPNVVESGISVGLTVFELIFSTVTVFVIAFYWLTERPTIKRYIFSFVPEDKRPRGRVLWDSVEGKLGAWVRGQALLMLFIFALSLIGYFVMGLKYPFALAVFAGLTEIIPVIGPYIGGAASILVALTQNPLLALSVAIFIVVLQLIEGNILVPRIMEKAVGVSPLTVIIGLLVGSTLYGILGALLAVPIAAAIQVIFNNVVSFGSEVTSTSVAQSSSTDTTAAINVAARANEVKRQRRRQRMEEDEETPTGPAAPTAPVA